MSSLLRAFPALLLLVPTALAQPVIDGSASDPLYGGPLVLQDTQTGFGDASIGRPDWADGSELDAAYAVVYGDTLYLVLAGNFETNGNTVDIFFDTIPFQGQNQLVGELNPDIDFGALWRMGFLDFENPGLTFAVGFEADYYLTVRCYGDPTQVWVAYAELYVDELNPGVGYYLGEGQATCDTDGGELIDAWEGAPVVRCTLDNRNVLGVTYGFDVDFDNFGVLTGLELAIPLDAIGSPSGDFEFVAFLNGPNHDFVSNQVLGGILGEPPWNLGEPRWIDFSFFTPFHFPVPVPIVTEPIGACCTSGDTCLHVTEAECISLGGAYLGDNVSCDGNPCDTIPAGACCVDDGYSGACFILNAAECAAAGGAYLGDGMDCLGCPCLLPVEGACCTDVGICEILTEDDCYAAGGSYAGHFTMCEFYTCVPGACCIIHECEVLHDFECYRAGGRYLGDETTCDGGPCDQTIWTPTVAGDMNGWDELANPMAEVAPGVYEATFLLEPYGRYEFKITDGTWDHSLPADNSWCYADEFGETTITYDANEYDDGWAPGWDRIGLSYDDGFWTAVGDWQGWDPYNFETEMTPLGGGIYVYEGIGLPAGRYSWKAVVSGTWDAISWNGRSIAALDMQFGVAGEWDPFDLYVDALTGTVMIELTDDCNNNDISDELELAECDGSPWCDDCNVNGIPDECDIASGESDDLNDNGIPDECEGCAGQLRGDSFCDGLVNSFDIDCFVAALSGGESGWLDEGCNDSGACDFTCVNDINCDGLVNSFDIDWFVLCLTGGCPPCP